MREYQEGCSLPGGARFHEDLAPLWEAGYARGVFARRERFIRRVLARRVTAGSRWLDAGCGSGHFTRVLAEQGAFAIGIDGAPAMIAEARRLSSCGTTAKAPAYILVDTLEHLGFKKHSFDGVICLSVLEYVDDPGGVLSAMARVVRPGGVVIASVPHRFSIVRGIQAGARALGGALRCEAFPYLRYSRNAYVARSLRAVLEDQGLRVQCIAGFHALRLEGFLGWTPPSLIFVEARNVPTARE